MTEDGRLLWFGLKLVRITGIAKSDRLFKGAASFKVEIKRQCKVEHVKLDKFDIDRRNSCIRDLKEKLVFIN